jgi:DNA modification methylase
VTDFQLQPYRIVRRRGVTLQFFLGDCLEVIPRLPRQTTIDVVVTSAPYML